MKKLVLGLIISTAPAMAGDGQERLNYDNQQMMDRSRAAIDAMVRPEVQPAQAYAPPVDHAPGVTIDRSSLGGERRGLIGSLDETSHGKCWQSAQDGRTYCER